MAFRFGNSKTIGLQSATRDVNTLLSSINVLTVEKRGLPSPTVAMSRLCRLLLAIDNEVSAGKGRFIVPFAVCGESIARTCEYD